MKYKLTEETKEYFGRTLHRIVCVTAFANVSAGELGGWIENEQNLDQCGNAWVYGDAKVYGDAWVCDNAQVCDNAKVYGDAKVCGNAWVGGNADVYGDAKVCGNAEVCGNAKVYGTAWVCDNAWVYGDAKVCGDAKVYGNAWVCDNAKVCGNAKVGGNADVCDNAQVCGNADYIVLKNNWSSGRYFTYTLSNKKWKVGCFFGTGEELIQKAYADSELSGKCYEASVKYVEELIRIKEGMKCKTE